jgi:hypothetical protein
MQMLPNSFAKNSKRRCKNARADSESSGAPASVFRMDESVAARSMCLDSPSAAHLSIV